MREREPTAGASLSPVNRLNTAILSVGPRCRSRHCAVTLWLALSELTRATTTSLPARAPAHICSGNVVFTWGGSGGLGGGCALGVEERHSGMFTGGDHGFDD